MKKSRFIKRFMALILVVLMSIDAFAAIVGDNDGAAFITKAEFDSMKNDFQTQLDRYNSSIDNKIDGAIASYLSGVRVSQMVKSNLVFSNWPEYTMLSYALEPTFEVPKMHADYFWMHNANFALPGWVAGHSAMQDHQYHEQGAVHGVFDYETLNDMCKNIIDVYNKTTNDEGNESDGLDATKSYFVWKGRSTDWHEELNMGNRFVISSVNSNNGDLPGAAGIHLWFLKSFSFVLPSQGYRASGLNVSDFWQPVFAYTSNEYPSGVKKDGITTYGYLSWSCSANKYDYEHVGNWSSTISWEVSNPKWQHTYRLSSKTNITSSSLYNSIREDSFGGWIKDMMNLNIAKDWKNKYDAGDFVYAKWWEVFTPAGVTASFTNSAEVNTYDTLATKVPSIGLAGSLTANQIQQTKGKFTYTDLNDNIYEHAVLYLQEGYPLIYAKKDSKIEWTPNFKDVTGTGLSNASEVNMVFTYGKFGDGIDCGNKYITKEGDTSSTNMIWTTSGLKGSVKFTMPEDGWIIAKWWPGTLTAANAGSVEWSITLDNENSNTILVTDTNS